jgi:hypothetical protein
VTQARLALQDNRVNQEEMESWVPRGPLELRLKAKRFLGHQALQEMMATQDRWVFQEEKESAEREEIQVSEEKMANQDRGGSQGYQERTEHRDLPVLMDPLVKREKEELLENEVPQACRAHPAWLDKLD